MTELIVEKVDYGSAQYNRRPLDAVVTEIKLVLKNRIIGDFQTYCRSIRAMLDSDFDMWRQFEVDTCGSTDKPWFNANSFESKWRVYPGD